MNLWPHQEETKNFALGRLHVVDTSSPGTGKTRAHIETFVERHRKGESSRLLVVCPRTLMATAWGKDLETFAPHLSYQIAYANRRAEAFAEPADVYIINPDGVSWLAKQPEGWHKTQWGTNSTLVIDESTVFKNQQAKRTRAMIQIAGHFLYRAALSATPAPNSVTELWAQARIVDGGERLGRHYFKFRSLVQTPIEERGFTKWVDREDARSAVALLLDDIAIGHDFDEVMTHVPAMTHRTITFDLPPRVREAYEELKETSMLELEKGSITAVNAAVLTNKLLQVASGSVYDSEGNAQFVATDRYELIADLIDEREQTVLFFNWSHQKVELSNLFSKRGINHVVLDSSTPDHERRLATDRFQAGEYQAILLHPKTGAHGLTLTKGRTVLWASPRYEADLMKQGIFRIRRGTQDQLTENLMIAAADTIEPDVYERLHQKIEAMESITDLLRAA